MKPVRVMCLAIAVAFMSHPALAQTRSDPGKAPAANLDVEVLAGAMNYDLGGTGTTVATSVRINRPLTRRLTLGVGATFASPSEQPVLVDGERLVSGGLFFLPEAQVRYQWQARRVQPFVSGGLGTLLQNREGAGARWRLATSAGAGARVALTERIHATGEFRMRGFSGGAARAAEWLGGIGASF